VSEEGTGYRTSLREEEEAKVRIALAKTLAMKRLDRINYLQLEVADLDRSGRWYRRMLSLKPAPTVRANELVILKCGQDLTLHLVRGSPARSRHFRIGLQLDSRPEVRAWRAHMDHNGATASPIEERDSYYGFILADPDGYVLEFFTAAPEDDE